MKKLWSSPPVLFLREALLLYFSRRVPQAAASLAYFVLLTVFPVLICATYLLGLVNIDVVPFIDQLQTVLPAAALEVLESYLRYISSHQSIGLFFAGLAAGWFSAAAAFRTITQVIVDMYENVSQSMLRGLVSSILFPGGHRPADPGRRGPAAALPLPGGRSVVLDPVCAAVLHLLPLPHGGAEPGRPHGHPPDAHDGEQPGLRPGPGGVLGGVLLVHRPVYPAVPGVRLPGVLDHPPAVAVPLRADPLSGDRLYQRVVPLAAAAVTAPLPFPRVLKPCPGLRAFSLFWGPRSPGFSRKAPFMLWIFSPGCGIMYHSYGILALAVALPGRGLECRGGVTMRQQSFQKALSLMTETGFRLFVVASLLFAGLTKKGLRRGDWRFLTQKEVEMLRMGAFE